MKIQIRFAAFAVLLTGLVFAAHAETPKAGEKISLKLKLPKGEKKSFVTVQDMNNQISAGGQNIDIKTKMTMNTDLEVKDVAEDGISTIEVIHKRVQLLATGPLEMRYDSDDPKTANNVLAQQVKGLAGKSVSAKFNSRGKVVESKDANNADISAKLQDSRCSRCCRATQSPSAILGRTNMISRANPRCR
jgi:hypothetical protein